jgi:hypothetical protein
VILEVASKSGIVPEEFDSWNPNKIYPREGRDNKVIDQFINDHIDLLRAYKNKKWNMERFKGL